MTKHKEWCRSVHSFGSCDCGATTDPVATSTTSEHHQLCDFMLSNCVERCDCKTEEFKKRMLKLEADDDGVRKPSHYQVFDGVESIEIIARSMTVSEFRGFCMGNVLKYRLRAGKKSELATMEKDLNKAAFYQELFDLHKGKCYAAE